METPIRLQKVAEMTGFSEITLRRWINRGWGPPYRKTESGIYLFKLSDIEAWLASLDGKPELQSAR